MIFDRYNPVLLSRSLASMQKDHTVVIGCGNLGRRLVEYLAAHNRPFVVVEETQKQCEEMLEVNDPVVVVCSL